MLRPTPGSFIENTYAPIGFRMSTYNYEMAVEKIF